MASKRPVSATSWPQLLICATACLMLNLSAEAAGVPVGTVIQNTATVDFELSGTPLTLQSNTTTIVVAERIDVSVTLQSPQVLVAANDTNRALLFTVTNIGNGTETFSLAIDNVLLGDDFDPTASATPIYFDTDGSGDLNVGDQPYAAGTNDPILTADESVDVLLLNDIPNTVVNGNIGFSQLTATSLTGTGVPGTEYLGQGDGNVDAVIGTTGGESAASGEYLVSDVAVSVAKTQSVSDLLGGTQPLPGATITYTLTVEVTSTGTTTATVLRDQIPTYTTYLPNSITLNSVAISDLTDVDAGELDTVGAPTVVVRLGDLTQADGVQTVVFEVTID